MDATQHLNQQLVVLVIPDPVVTDKLLVELGTGRPADAVDPKNYRLADGTEVLVLPTRELRKADYSLLTHLLTFNP
jgi:hypothetical protein